jgi:hypothetical protein
MRARLSAHPYDLVVDTQGLLKSALLARLASGPRAGFDRASVRETLEDTPFYVRSVLNSSLLGERVVSVHETLNVPRFASTAVQLMLPWRMPRRG